MNVPVAVSICLATWLTACLAMGESGHCCGNRGSADGHRGLQFFATGHSVFILSGLLMGRGGIARRLMDLAAALVGRFPGGLALVNVLSCMMFGSVSGSATAAVSSIGGFMIPEMERKGYGKDFSVALTITSATTGLLIPPSNIMIVYALVSGGTVSIAALFMGGLLPGVVFGLLLMLTAAWICRRRGYGMQSSQEGQNVWRAGAFLSLLLIVVVLGGILRESSPPPRLLPLPLPMHGPFPHGCIARSAGGICLNCSFRQGSRPLWSSF